MKSVSVQIDLTPWVRAPFSGIGRTAGLAFESIQRLGTGQFHGVSRQRSSGIEWLDPSRRLIGWKNRIYHSFEHRLPPVYRSLTVLSLHDLWTLRAGNAWQSPEFQKRQGPILRSAIARADWITVPSESVLRELQELFPETRERSAAVPWGPTLKLPPQSPSFSHPELVGGKRTLLTVSVIEPRKNLGKIPAALAQVPGVRWCLIGKIGYRGQEILDQLTADCARLGVELVRQEALSDEELIRQLQAAHAVVLPSSEEGFGLPALEGALLGRPLFLSEIGPFREIAGAAAAYFDPAQVEEALPALLQELVDASHSEWSALSLAVQERARSLTWDQTAAKFFRVYSALSSGT